MREKAEVVVEGPSVEAAVRQGLRLLGASRAEVDVFVEQTPRRGLMGLGRRSARVRLIRRSRAPDDLEALLRSLTVGTSTAPPSPPAAPPSPPQDATAKDGTASIRQGLVIVTPPEGAGRWPVIRPGAHTLVLVDGVPIDRVQMVRDVDQIEVRVMDEVATTEVKAEVSRDGLRAFLVVQRRPGRRYTLPDHPPAVELTVMAAPAESIAAPPVTEEQVRSALAAAGIVFGIDEKAIERVLTEQETGPVLVASGLPPEPPVHGRVQCYFSTDPLVRRDPDEAQASIDLLALFQVPSVKPGDLLAVKHPPREGRAGRTVTGKSIPVPEAKDVKLRAGPGALLDEGGLRVYATAGGRPTFTRGVVSVRPEYVVPGNVSATTGHVQFDGDVVVQGNVSDGMRVMGAGRVVIAGTVSGAYVRGEEGVLIGRGIVRSRVEAGGFSHFGQLLRALGRLKQDLSDLMRAVQTVKSHPHFRTTDLQQSGDGPLVKLLIERKFPELPGQVQSLVQLTRQADATALEPLEPFVRTCQRLLLGLGPLELRDSAELGPLAEAAGHLFEQISEQQSRPADVVVRYVQNSSVEASGRIRMPAGACFYARLFAGRGVFLRPGLFRGDAITVQEGDVLLDEVGSPSGSKTHIEILTAGRFSARLVHANVRVTIGGRSHTFQRQSHGVEVQLNSRGELEIRQAAHP